MTAKDKAQELVDEFKQQLLTITPNINRPIYQAKKFALIAVDEIIDNIVDDDKQVLNYWAEVKQEIENL